MNTIRVLSEKVAIRIAAGEVIDRPSSVVRELIDNSIDAGATRIAVRIGRGGRSVIRVSDDGVGMPKDDLLLCIERHATSKIRDLDDLYNINTLGFRGEALASIAAVSRLTITTRPKGSLTGFRLKMAGGKLESIDEVGSPEGTVVEVRDLFYNVPARRKFLRTPRTETDNVIDVFTRIALGFENIQFLLETEEKVLLNLPRSKELIPRLSLVLGRKVAEQMLSSSGRMDGVKITAYIGSPDFARSRADRVYVYVNRRNIRDAMITKAIIEGYGQRLMKGLYPQVVLFIDAEPSMVDVNVHPAKQEVRFQDSAGLFRKIVQVIDTGLGKTLTQYPVETARTRHEHVGEPVQISWQETMPGSVSDILATSPEDYGAEIPRSSLLDEEVRLLGQLNSTYILCEGREGLIIIDQHAAHERVLYDKLMKAINESSLEVQTLLLPRTIEVSVREKRVLEENKEVLSELGIEVEDFGGQAILLRAIPSILENADWELLISQLISILEQNRVRREVLLDHVIAVLACHGAIRAGDRLTDSEMESLLQQLNEAALPTNCPHGRPVLRKITYYELEKMFKRVI
ncbi:MAG TPA: DNA mismatch repair endonuclease MutL [Desulfobacterales bacterium]|nr:DNA mismatch repair endonuclease MutL [Desulfobacterales bacterium]